MKLEIPLTPETAAKLESRAHRLGTTPADYARDLLEQSLCSETIEVEESDSVLKRFSSDPADLIRAMDEFAERNKNYPALSVDAFDREHIYSDED
jgi:hypothetical protein